MMSTLTSWWKQQDQRNRRALTVLAAVCLPLLYWEAVYTPVKERLIKSQGWYAQKADEQTWLKRQKQSIEALLNQASGISANPEKVDDTTQQEAHRVIPGIIRDSGLEVVSFEPVLDTGVRVKLDNQSMTSLWKSLQTIESTTSFKLVRFNLKPTEQLGYVNAQLEWSQP